jgi:hypothetical protein
VRPGRLWRDIDIHDPPRVGPLLVMVCLAIALFASANATTFGVNSWNLNRIPWVRGWVATSADLWDLPGFVIRAHVDPESYVMVPGVTLWCVFSCCALLIFRQSMRLYKVRTVHVVRVWAHAVPLMLPVAFAGFVTCVILAEWAGPAWLDDELVVLACAFPVYVLWSLRQGYRHYLHMPHASAVAVASQLVAIMATVAAMVTLYLR